MDVITMASVVQLGLIQRDRIFTVSVLLPDRPGELNRVSGLIAEEQGNVIKLEHNQFYSTNRNAACYSRGQRPGYSRQKHCECPGRFSCRKSLPGDNFVLTNRNN